MRDIDYFFALFAFLTLGALAFFAIYLGPRVAEDNNWIGMLTFGILSILILVLWNFSAKEVRA